MNTVVATKNKAVLEALAYVDEGVNPDEILLRERDAWELLPCQQATLRKSRTTGVLLGQPTPPYVKVGRQVHYRLSDLMNWRDAVLNAGPIDGRCKRVQRHAS